mgnify:CR=1 FL=1
MIERPDDQFKRAQDKSIENPGRKFDQRYLHVPITPDPILNPNAILERAIANEVSIQRTKDMLGIGARSSGSEAPREQPQGLSSAEVKTKQDFRLAMDMMKHSFTDPTDLETNQAFCKLFFTPALASYYLMKDGDKPIGVELMRINPNVPDAMYIPYAGIHSEYRNQGIYPKAAEISDEQMRERGKDHVLYEFEDRRVLTENVYPDEKPEDVLRRVEGRQNFWKRSVDCHIVNDRDVPYCRPAADDPQKIQAYDSLAFRMLDKLDPKWGGVFNEDTTAISRESYETFYLEIMQLEYGNKDSVPTKDELRRKYPAIDKFFMQLDAHPDKKWISIDTTKPREKATPDNPNKMTVRGANVEERDRWKHVPSKGTGWEESLRDRKTA